MWRGSPPEATKTPGPCGTRRRPNMMDCSLSRLSVQNGRTKSWWSAPQRQQHGVSRRRARRHVGTPAPAKPRAHSVGPSCRAQPRGGFSCRGAQKRRKRRAQKAGGLTDVRRDAVALLVDVDDGGVGLLGGGEHAPAHRRGTDAADDARMTAMTPGSVRRMVRRARDSSAFMRKAVSGIHRPIAPGEHPWIRSSARAGPDRAADPDFRLPPPRRPRINFPAS